MEKDQVSSTEKQLNKIIEFRQQVYAHGLTKARDAQFELIDALLSNRSIQSFPELSFAPVHRRQWHSAYAALENGQQERDWLDTAINKSFFRITQLTRV